MWSLMQREGSTLPVLGVLSLHVRCVKPRGRVQTPAHTHTCMMHPWLLYVRGCDGYQIAGSSM